MNVETKNNTAPKVKEISFSGLMRAADVELAVGLSRVTIWRLEREEKFPARVQVSSSRVGWHGHEIKKWIDSRPRVDISACEEEAITA